MKEHAKEMEKPQPHPEKSSRFHMPHVYVILFMFTAWAAVATYIIPAGTFEEIPGPEGRTTIDPESYQQIASDPIGIVDFMLAVPNGLVAAAEVVFFTFVIGGMFMVLRRTGIIEIAVDRLTRKFSNKSLAIVPVLMFVFAFICSLIGTQELSLVYVPVILPLMVALKYDSVTAAAIALIATTAGFTAGFLNPINTGLGQQVADVPLYSGLGVRIALFLTLAVIGILWVLKYAKKVKQRPELSLTYKEDEEKRSLYLHTDDTKAYIFHKRQKVASMFIFIFFGILIYGVLAQGWFMLEMAGLFIIMGIVVGMIAGLTPSQVCDGFNEGFRDVLAGAMIVGVARAVAVVMEEGQIMDTIVHGLGTAVSGMPVVLSAGGMFVIQFLFNFLVPSGSGQALVTMPIMAPLSDLLGVTRQTSVLAYQLGDGLGNIIFPTSGYFMATLALAGVPWHKWVKFYFPLLLIWMGIAIIFLTGAQLLQWNG
ncbi:YfcC family protein [Marinococcus halophilus]|uniref:C4-dicarboxylate ABC transporter n=1 Tax=Marinococcus halophilus TaxID=1371 RepID=A0A510Y728_MARHA|nr:YfcC family protein [Marinococcus halophilus]GEK59169.1 C4-dicarboxylate ABC transporter [Marinococcus halophilus]